MAYRIPGAWSHPFVSFRTSLAFLLLSAVVTIGGLTLLPLQWYTDTAGAVEDQHWESPLVADPQSLDLGVVDLQEKLEHQVWIRNISPSEVRIVGISKSCNCVSLGLDSAILQAGESVPLEVHLDLAKSLSAESDRLVPISVLISAVLENYPAVSWEVKGQVRLPFHASARNLTLGPLVTGRDGTCTASVTVTAKDMVRHLEARCEPPLGSVVVSSHPGSDREFDIRITCDARNLTPGSHHFKAYVAGDNGGRIGASPSIPICDCWLQVVEPVVAIPRSVLLRPGEENSVAVVLRPQGPERFVVRRIDVDPPELAVQPDNEAGVFQLSMNENFSGKVRQGRVAFAIETASGRSFEIMVPVIFTVASQ